MIGRVETSRCREFRNITTLWPENARIVLGCDGIGTREIADLTQLLLPFPPCGEVDGVHFGIQTNGTVRIVPERAMPTTDFDAWIAKLVFLSAQGSQLPIRPIHHNGVYGLAVDSNNQSLLPQLGYMLPIDAQLCGIGFVPQSWKVNPATIVGAHIKPFALIDQQTWAHPTYRRGSLHSAAA